MDFGRSGVVFINGVLKRSWPILVFLLIDQLELYNTYIRHWLPESRRGEFAIPTELTILILAGSLLWASIATYNELRKALPDRPVIKIGPPPYQNPSDHIDLAIENTVGPFAEFEGQYSVKTRGKIFSSEESYLIQHDLQSVRLAPRDEDTNRIPIHSGSTGIFHLCRAGIAAKGKGIEFAKQTRDGIEWINATVNKGLKFDIEMTIKSEPPHT